MSGRPAPVAYTERLRVPFSYWAIALFFGLTFVTAVGFLLGEVFLLVSVLLAVALIAWTLLAWGALTLTVDTCGVRVGPHRLDWPYVGRVEVADVAVRRRVMARDDVHLVLRPYASGLVVIGVVDAADPHLCWLVSTRNPEQLVAAIRNNRPSGAAEASGRSALDSGE